MFFIFVEQKTAYEMRMSDGSSDVCSSDLWGFKMEAYDAIEENAAILSKAGVCVAIHSDEQRLIQRLNAESAVAIAAGRRAGIDIPQEEARSEENTSELQ